MQKFFSWLCFVVVVIACNSSKSSSGNPSTDNSRGYTSLFNARNTKGWHRYGGGAIDSVWKVKDGMLWLDAAGKKQAGIKGDWDIVTDEEYENFDLQADWRIAKNGNSGIVFLIHEDKAKYNWPWETG